MMNTFQLNMQTDKWWKVAEGAGPVTIAPRATAGLLVHVGSTEPAADSSDFFKLPAGAVVVDGMGAEDCLWLRTDGTPTEVSVAAGLSVMPAR